MNKATHVAIQVCIAIAILSTLNTVSEVLNGFLTVWQREWSVEILTGIALVGWIYSAITLSDFVEKLRREEED